MGTKERLEILKEKLEEKPKWWVINMEEQPKVVENGHIYTEPPAETRLLASQKVINELLEKVSNLEFEVERLNNKLKKIDNLVEKICYEPLVEEDMFAEFYNEYQELKGEDKE